MAKEKVELIAKKVGTNLIVMIDGVKYVKSVKDNLKLEEKIKNKIKLYNKTNGKTLKEELLDILSPSKVVKEKEKQETKGLKKSIKKAKKEVKPAEKKAKKEKVAKTDKILKKGKEKVAKTDKIRKEDIEKLVKAKDGGMAMKGFEEFSMPDLLVARLEEYLDAERNIRSLLNFWSLCLLNLNPIARTKLFDYLTYQKLLITASGYFVTYRMVKIIAGEKDIFTDAHTGKLRYKVGTVCAIPREECDEDGARDCSKGLHTGTPLFIGIDVRKEKKRKDLMTEGKDAIGDGYGVKFVTTKAENPQSYGTGYDRPSTPRETTQRFSNEFGNQAIICLINPAHVVSIPNSDTRKMRSCEFYFAKLTTPEEVIDLQLEDYFDIDLDYQKLELEQIQEMLKDKDIKQFIEYKGKSAEKLNELQAKLVAKEIQISSDKINATLPLEKLREIINQRKIVLNGKRPK